MLSLAAIVLSLAANSDPLSAAQQEIDLSSMAPLARLSLLLATPPCLFHHVADDSVSISIILQTPPEPEDVIEGIGH